MVATGVPKLDDALGGGLKPQSSVLFCAQPGVEILGFALQTLFNRLEAGDHGLYFVNNKPPKAVETLAAEYGWNLEGYRKQGAFAFFDAYSALLSEKPKTEFYSDEPADIKKISAVVPGALARLQSRNTIFVFDALSTLLDAAKKNSDVLASVKTLLAQARNHNATSLFLFTEWLYPKTLTTKIKALFDCVIELRAIERKVILQKYFSVSKAVWAFEKRDIPFKMVRPGGVKVFIPKILVTGPYNAGKSSFIHSASTRAVSVDRFGTTVALDHGHVEHSGFEADLFGTPGQERFDPILELLGSEALGVIIVVDSTDPKSFGRAKEMIALTKASDLPAVIVANKANLKGALKPDQIRKSMKLPKEIPIIPVVAEDLKKVKQGKPAKLKKSDIAKVLDKLFEVIV